LGGDKRYLYVSNWGSNSVSAVDMQTNRRVEDIPVGVRPNDMAVSPDGRLFVACAGDNTVHVIQTATLEKPGEKPSPTRPITNGTREIITTSLYPQSPEGSTPDAVTISPDGKVLFVANADTNDVLVVTISAGSGYSEVSGFIPTAWYPSALAVSPDGKTLFVGNGKGKSRANFTHMEKNAKGVSYPAYDYIPTCWEGSVSIIAQPTSAQMAAYTEQVRKNCPYKPEYLRQSPTVSHGVVPDKVGQPCPIKYVLYIIKENRTYDQMYGDFRDATGKPTGNGDPRLTMYGESVTPNQHQLARDYELLDNLYCSGEVSSDGHSWCDAAMATDYKERSWVMSYSGEGDLPGEELANPTAGYLWDQCRRFGVSFKDYGEAGDRVASIDHGTWVEGWFTKRDIDRADDWIHDLRAAEKSGVLPRFSIMSLPENHTCGTDPSRFTPEACVASNDIGVAKIVAAASRSKFWKEMAIFIIEDDAQNGPDHVDAHRTDGLVISPWCKRGLVDSTLYTTASMVRTMELILGLPPMTQYDASATPMFACFGKECKVTPYEMLKPKVDIYAKNPKNGPGAKESSKMDFSEPDKAPEDQLNRILWVAAKGTDVPYPPVREALLPRE
jgi:YVTN family beta-propeller protein